MMDTPLLTTKLYVPPIRPKLVPRPRLVERLNAGLHRKLTLISAPAGFGKTTLVSEWVQQADRPVAWLSLDENDNNLARFLTYLVAALQQIDSSIRVTLQAVPGSDQLPGVEPLLTALINEITTALTDSSSDSGRSPLAGSGRSPLASSGRSPLADPGRSLVLVLDDYHVISDLPIHDALNFLINHLPPQMHLVITSRTDPPLPLSRLRARNQLTELRSADLRFTLDEATAFLNQVMRLNLSADDLAVLEGRTEGWIAGLQMAAIAAQSRFSLQGLESVKSFVKAFSGSHRYILDYLADEVFYRQPENVQTFLLQTSILDRLTSGLCDAVTGRSDGQAILERLEHTNLFIVSLDDDRHWYRYHHLFADLLRYRLDQAQPNQVSELHRRACEWCAQNGLVYEAMGHALAAGDFERAARLVEETDPASMVMRGEVATLLDWLDALPDKVMRSRPRLSLSCAWALFLTTDVDAIEPRLQDAMRALGVDEADELDRTDAPSAQVEELLGEIAALRAFVALYRGDAHRAIELAQQALGHLPKDYPLGRSAVASVLGDAYLATDHVTAAGKAYVEAMAGSQAAGHTLLTMVMTDDLARWQVVQGRLHQAAKTFRQVLQWGSGRRRPLYPVGQAYVGLGDVLREWNDLDGAERYLLEGIVQCQLGGYARYLLFSYIALARVKQARGNADATIELIREADQLAERVGVIRDVVQVAAYRARLWLAQGNLAAATRWVHSCGLSAEDQPSYLREVEYLTLARVLIAEGKREPNGATLPSALELLARLLQAAETSGRMGSVIEILVLWALALQAQGKAAKAMIALERAMVLAEPEGYVRLFVDEGVPMVKLLRRAASRRVLPDYVDKLLAAFGETGELDSFMVQTLIEPLTRRELEVLHLLAAGLSNQEIAQELAIAIDTVKTHTHKIYGKLDVRNRTRAVARAREWNLLYQ